MIKKLTFVGLITLILSSCVSSKVYKDLESQYANLKKDMRAVEDENADLLKAKKECEDEVSKLESEIATLKSQKTSLEEQIAGEKKNLDALKDSYNTLEKQSNSALAENVKRNADLQKELAEKEKEIAKENTRLLNLQKELDARSKRIDELEAALAAKDANMKSLKDAISKALTNFEGKGLTVEQRDGKVYVSMENKLLFNSGSWSVGTEGKKAVSQLGEVLAQNPDINVLIEGHTDDDPYTGKGDLSGNWDLSTKRATEIVKILVNISGIKPENLTAAGKSKFVPLAANSTPEGKAKNRRIEVVLTPKLDAISKLLNE